VRALWAGLYSLALTEPQWRLGHPVTIPRAQPRHVPTSRDHATSRDNTRHAATTVLIKGGPFLFKGVFPSLEFSPFHRCTDSKCRSENSRCTAHPFELYVVNEDKKLYSFFHGSSPRLP
jgi:hypothetical protein